MGYAYPSALAALAEVPSDHSSFAVLEGWRGEIKGEINYWLQSDLHGDINRCRESCN